MNHNMRCKIIQKLFLAVFMLFLAACSTREPEVRIVKVDVPILIPCKTQEVVVSTWATSGLNKSDSLEAKVRALLAERRQRIGYERELIAAVASCH